MTSAALDVIAEVEGIKTPRKKRTKKEIEQIFAENAKETAKKKKARAAKSPKATVTPKPTLAKNADAKSQPVATADPVEMCFVSESGYVREIGYDEKKKLFHVAFAKSIWAIPSSKKVWDEAEKAIADKDINFDAWYRIMSRGRTAEMLPVKTTREV